jgi:glycosyltransferase involved in cell wall biosynthesis
VKSTILVVTTVHWPDDTRIRERLVRTLTEGFEVRYATREPGPSDKTGLEWIPLRGGRIRRDLAALWLAFSSRWDVLVVHDPELIPVALLARIKGRVVLDVHEDIPATALTRKWVPKLVGRPLAWLLSRLLRISERLIDVTLAEPGYQRMFDGDHPVFPNYPDTSRYPEPGDGKRSAVYLGDVTADRGARVAVEAAAKSGIPLVFIGRVSEELGQELTPSAHEGQIVELRGELPNPAALAEAALHGVGIAPLLDIPNYRYSAPTKVLEYLALGLPVVASDLPGTRVLVDGLEAVELVAPADAAALAEAMQRALEPDMRAVAAAQVATVRKRFRWPSGEVLDYYRSLL